MSEHDPVTFAVSFRSGDLAALDERLLRALDGAWERVRLLAREDLACRPGCTPCCIGPFPITLLDAWRLARGLRELAARTPERARAILARARESWLRMEPDFPGDRARGLLGEDEGERERFLERHAALPCPVLDPETGRCDLYAWRPVSCRTYGPPVRFGATRLPPCPLCFQRAPRERIEACRIEPDPEDLEGKILERLRAKHAEEGETVIACALSRAGLGGHGSPGKRRRARRVEP